MKRADYARWKNHRKGKGFSLTELVIVIIIIAILALAVFAGGSAAIKKAKISRATSDLHNFDVALQTYMFSNRDPVKLTVLSPKEDFNKVVDGLNPFLPMGYTLKSVTLPTSGNIFSTLSFLNVYESEKKDPWDNPYYFLIDPTARNAGETEYYFIVMSAGQNAQAKEIPITPETKDELNINPETGEVEIPQEQVIGTATEVFGEKIYGAVEDGTFDAQIKDAFENAASKTPEETRSAFDEFKEKFKGETVKGIIDIAKGKYQENIRTSDANSMAKTLGGQFDRAAEKVYSNYQIEQRLAENDRLDALRSRHETGKSEAEIEAEFERKKQELQESLQDKLSETVKDFIETSTQNVVETVEKKIKEREKTGIEDAIRDHLRGFSRTIPSFLMAYGDDTVTLATFDSIIPNRVFVEVTSITLDQFRFLRDGGKYTDAETGEEKQFAGNLFDQVVFDDSVKEFLRLKKKLADYFDEKSIEDIFDYIPPQKTNQIFTPKVMVKKMVDMLEDENPGCFDDPDKTFIDLYMKSGLYITEIVKRLYQSERMKAIFPDKKERLRHIFEKQVYGLAPTEIIYNIALSYILGFDEKVEIKNHNFRQVDALPYAKEGTLSELLDELFGE